MNDKREIEVQLVKDDRTSPFVVTRLRADSVTVLEKTASEDLELKKTMPVKLLFPLPSSEGEETISGTITGMMVKKAGEAKLRLLDITFDPLSDSGSRTISAYLAKEEEERNKERAKAKSELPDQTEIAVIQLEEYLRPLKSTAFSEDDKKELLTLIEGEEKAILEQAPSEDPIAKLVAMKLKMKHEEILFQRCFSSTEQYVDRINEIMRQNGEHALDWLSSVDKSTIPEKDAPLFDKLSAEARELYDTQNEYVRTCRELLKDGEAIEREALLAAARARKKPREQEAKEAPAAKVALGDPGTGKAKLIAAAVVVLICLGLSFYFLFKDALSASMLPTEQTIEAMKQHLPIERGTQQGFELYIYLDTGKVDMEEEGRLLEKVEKALAVATENRFKGIRVFSRTGKPLFVTAHANTGSRVFRMPRI